MFACLQERKAPEVVVANTAKLPEKQSPARCAAENVAL
jgi:hypothetical protein